MNPRIDISRHAWERFVTRWDGPFPHCPMKTLRKLLLRAQEEDLGSGAILRLLDNNMQPARYFAVDGWRFVTDENVTRLITAERIIHKKPRWKPKRRRR